MFSGIIEGIGEVKDKQLNSDGCRLKIECARLDFQSSHIGDSIAVNGVCLTAVEIGQDYFLAEVSKTTLERTNLGNLSVGSPVNLERSLRLNQLVNGHLVSGHVDQVVEIETIEALGFSRKVTLPLVPSLADFIVARGSVSLDGVSLTVSQVYTDRFDLTLIPETLKKTILQDWKVGSVVNIEIDLIARYLLSKRQLQEDAQQIA